MKLFLLAVLPLLIAPAAFAQPDPNTQGMAANPPETPIFQPQIRLDTPVNSVRYFMNALSNDFNAELNLSFVVAGARTGIYGADEWEEARRSVYPPHAAKNLKVDDIHVDEQTNETATVTVTAHSEYPVGGGRPVQRGEATKFVLQLRREAKPDTPGFGAQQNIWRVIPLSTEEVLAKPLYELPVLQLTATLVLRDPRLLSFLRQQRASSQLKQLALGALQFVQDYDAVFAFDDAAHERALLPYLKEKSIYTIAGTKDEKWRFNDNLSATRLTGDQKLAQTVLFYDGSAPDSEHLNFRFDGKTLICFADGHVAARTPDKIGDLIWKP